MDTDTSEHTLLELYRAKEARSNARFALQTRLPGRMIYFRSEMRRAISKWRSYAEKIRGSK